MAAGQAAGAHGLTQAWTRRGPLAWLLLPISLVFATLVGVRQWLYRLGLLKPQRLPVPVVVVGNLIAGGAGKTPATIAVVRLLLAAGYSPGVVSRGYGRTGDDVREVEPGTPAALAGDEPLLMRMRLGVPVFVGRDRVAAAQSLLRGHPATSVIVADDGLQHLRLPRSAQVIVFDERGAGNGWMLPAGPLREPLPRAVPQSSLVLYNAPQASVPLPGHLARRALAGAVELPAWRAGVEPTMQALESLRDRDVVAAAGLAHPAKFFDMLRSAGLRITELPLPDHHRFDDMPWPQDTPDVLVTEKDAVKLDPARLGSTRVWVVPLDFRLGTDFEQALLALLPPPLPRTAHGQPTA